MALTPWPVIDVHTHLMPLGLPDMAARTGDTRWPSLLVEPTGVGRIMRGDETFRHVTATTWDPAARHASCGSAPGTVHVISPVPVTFVYWAEPALATTFVREQNDRLAAIAAASDGSYLAMGGVPLQDIDAAIGELERFATLGLVGVEIGASVEGRELDDPSLRPFFEAVEATDLPVFVHPGDGGTAIRRSEQPFAFGLGMHADTAMAAAALVFGGVLERFPDLRIGLAHGCGSFAWSYPRLRRFAELSSGVDAGATDALVRSLWVDSLVFEPAHLPLLIERFGGEHVMLGSDYPFMHPSWGADASVVDAAVALGFCTEAQAAGILGGNAARFLKA